MINNYKKLTRWTYRGFAPQSATRALPWTSMGAYSTRQTSCWFFMPSAWGTVFCVLQTQFETQKQYYDKVLGKFPFTYHSDVYVKYYLVKIKHTFEYCFSNESNCVCKSAALFFSSSFSFWIFLRTGLSFSLIDWSSIEVLLNKSIRWLTIFFNSYK